MKKLTLLLLVSFSTFAAEINEHVQSASVDCYIGSSVERDPKLPGMDASPRYYISVSVTTHDTGIGAFGVYMRVLMADATTRVIHVTLTDATTAKPSTITYFLGAVAPEKVVTLNVQRLRAELVEQLIRPRP